MRRVLLVAVALLATAVPAGADEPGAHVTDPCGDADALVWSGDRSVDHPDDRSGGFDIERGGFEDLRAGDDVVGVRVSLELCADVPDARAFATSWNVRWRLEDPTDPDTTCGASVQLADINTLNGLERAARFTKSCSEPHVDVLGRPGSQSYTVFSIDLTSYEVDGPRITWDLPRDAFSGESAAVLARGTRWQQPSATTSDTGATLFSVGIGNAGATTGVADRTGTGRSFVVG